MKQLILTPKSFLGATTISRNYTILEINYSDFTETEQLEILSEANKILNNAHSRAANSNIIRNEKTKENDAFAGILAEFAIMKFLNSLQQNSAYRPIITSTKNQIDIIWKYQKIDFSLEVRSSFVRNGIEFALYAINPAKEETYFDVLGPYYQEYKTTYDNQRDVYARVLFSGNKYNVKERFITQKESFYIIGFMYGEYLVNLNLHKSLESDDSTFSKFGSKTGDYLVSPINNITDIETFMVNLNNKSLNPFN